MSGSQAASMFGGALTGAGAGNFFTKLTAWLATIFFATCAVLAFMVSKQGANVNGRSDVRDVLVQDKAAPAATAIELPNTMKKVESTDDEIPPATPDVPEN